MKLRHPLTWIEISRSALLHNARHFRESLATGQTLMPVLKANAYGHGLSTAGPILRADGLDFFALHSADEILTLSGLPEMTGSRYLLLSQAPPEQVGELLRAGTRFGLFDLEGLDEIASAAEAAGLSAPVHIKLETGVQRQGFTFEDLPALAEALAAAKTLRVEGVYTHFANIEDTTDHSYARGQMDRFDAAIALLCEQGVEPQLVHASCSAAGILFPETWGDLLRVGISLYGHWPSRETRVSAQAAGRNQIGLRPCLSWKTRIIQIKSVAAGSLVGYGCSWKAESDTRLAVLPVGYSDGYDRGLGGAHVLVHGRRAPIRGRVMMNLLLVDVGHIPEAARGDEVLLLGRQGEEEISAELLAELSGTINYEILSRINPLLPRLAVD